MAINASKRSVMTLYSSGTEPHSHRARIVLAEKGVAFEIVDVNSSPKMMDELCEYNPYGSIPTLVDRDLVLYNSGVIMEYLDERFPHPPLMPVYPVAKGRSRLMIHRIDTDWYAPMLKILDPQTPAGELDDLRKQLLDSLVGVIPVFAEMPFFLSEEFSLVDCCIAPLLWRLPKLGIKLPEQAAPIEEYANRMFARESFKSSLSASEKAMRS